MRGLHVVGVSDDGTQVLLAASPDAARPSHAVGLDGRLRAAVNGEWRPDGRAESALSPKEIQARVRAGESVEGVARAAGVPIARVMPFAGPVLSERERVVEDARAAVARRERGACAQTPLGDLVDARLAGTSGLKPDTVTWSARRRDDGAWVVTLGYRARGGARRAEWLWHPGERRLLAIGAAAARLCAPESAAGRPRSKPKASTSMAASKRSSSKGSASKGSASKATSKGSASKPKRSTPKPAVRASASRVRVNNRAARSAPAVVAPTAAAATATELPVLVEPAVAASDATGSARPARNGAAAATIEPRPASLSWSDVLFGVAESPVVADAAVRNARPSRAGSGTDRRARRASTASTSRAPAASGSRRSGRRRA